MRLTARSQSSPIVSAPRRSPPTPIETPFEQLVNDLAPDRDLSRPPLFQAAFTLESSATDEASFAGVPVRIEGVDAGVTKYDLALIMRERPEGLRATLEFSTDIFERSTAQRMLGHRDALGAVNAPIRLCPSSRCLLT
jgi:non-ribosomal peptide synthetase component F